MGQFIENIKTELDTEKIIDTILNSDVDDYVELLCEFEEIVEDTTFMLKNPLMYTDNEKYVLLKNFRDICTCFSKDRRATGTLMKHLGI